MEKKKLICAVLALLLVCLNLAGCGAGSGNNNQSAPGNNMIYDQSNGSFNTGFDAAEPDAPSMPESSGGESGGAAPSQPHDKLIKRAELYLETTAFDSVAQSLEGIVDNLGGYFESRNISNRGTYRSAYYLVRVPAEHFEDLLGQVGSLCTVLSQSDSAENVSESYYDLEARLATQRTKLERLQELLARAEVMEDIISLETAISETELNIEYLTGSLRSYDALISYSSVQISLDEVYKVTEVETAAVGFGQRLGQAFASGFRSGVDALENFAIGLAYNWVGLLFLVVIITVLVLAIRRNRRRSRAALEARQREQNNTDTNSKS